MDAKLVEIGVQFRKFVMFSFRTLYRSACRNPFLVCMLFFLIFLYRFFPLLFSLLLSASPVLVSTAVLLGTLLSFGHPNIPEIEKEETVTDEIVSLKTGVPRDALVVEGDSSHPIERYTRKERDVEDKFLEETSSLANNVSEVDRDEFVVPTSPVREENPREFQFKNRVNDNAERELNEEKMGDEKGIENQYSLIQQSDNENDESETDNSQEGSVDSPMGEDHLKFSSGLPLKEEEEEEEEEERSDSGSDGDESSSPDASMADIIPMLDELHPLLDEEEATQPARMSDAGSDADVDAASQHSSRSGKSSNGSDADSETYEDLEVVEDEEEEATHGDKEEEAKAAITWTEDDEKNLMNLGTSELERNRRLESLIARRRSRKNMRMMAERNLIDFESTDLPFNVAPISTSRKNPFDLPFDSNDNIPGSAPSILLPRRNPFDLPYDSSEEKPDLVGDTFLQDSITFQPKEQPLFRRHESFNVGPSLFGGFRQEKQDIKLRPYFVPERIEEPNFSFLQRQTSEMSESKASSIPETESVGSAGDVEDKKLIDDDLDTSQRIEHASESSEDVETVEFVQVEKRDLNFERRDIVIKLGGEDDHQETESHLSETGSAVNLVELNSNVVDPNIEAVDQKNISRSSSSSDSDVNEKIFNEKEDGLSSLEQTQANLIEEPDVSTQHKEPVYDLSPTSSFKKEPSSSSVSSDPPVEVSDVGFLPVIVKRTLSLDENEIGSKEVGDINDASIDQEDSSDTSVEEDSLHKDRSLGVPDEEQSLISEEMSVTQPAMSFETEAIEENLIDKEVVLRYEQDQVHPSNVDDKSMNPSSDITEEFKEPPIIVRESIDDASTSHSLNVSETEAIHSMVTETELPSALADLKDSILNGLENADETHGINPTDSRIILQNNIDEEDDIKEIDEGLLSELDAVGDFSVRDSGSYLNEIVKHPVQEDSTAVLETEDIPLKIEEEISKYKDEMSRTSSIENHDSSIQELVHREVENPEDFESVNDKAEDSGVKQIPVVEEDSTVVLETKDIPLKIEEEISKYKDEMSRTSSIENHDSSIRELVHREVENPEDFESVNDKAEDSGVKQSPVVEEDSTVVLETKDIPLKIEEEISKYKDEMSRTSSIENHDSSIRELVHREVENPEDFESVNDEAEDSGVKQSPVVEMRAVEDFEPGFEKIGPVLMETEAGHVDAEVEPVMHVLEARSVEDIESAFKRAVNEKEIEKPIVVELSQAEPAQEETVAKRLEDNAVHSDSNLTENKLESPVIESRSMEDAIVDLNQVPEGNMEKLVKSDREDELAKFEANEAGSSSKDIESDRNELDGQETSTDAVEKAEDEVEGKKKKSRNSGSRSSSSSSSSSSDSDKE